MSTTKFERYRGRFRKVYAYGSSQPPRTSTVYDSFSESYKNIDFNTIERDWDFYSLPNWANYNDLVVIYGQFAETTASLSIGISSYDVTFPQDVIFTSTPIVTVQPMLTNDFTSSIGVNVYLSNVTTGGFTMNFSAPLGVTGTLKYEAISLPSGSNYPIVVQRYPYASGTYVTASAGYYMVTASSAVSVSFASLSGSISEFTAITQDLSPPESDSYIFAPITSAVSGSASFDLSAIYTGRVNYIALKP